MSLIDFTSKEAAVRSVAAMSAQDTPSPLGMTQIPVATLGKVIDRINDLEQSNRELTAACEGLLNIAETGVVSLGAIRAARDAIAKARKGGVA